MSAINTKYLYAAGTNQLSVMEECLAAGADPFATDESGSVLQRTSERNRPCTLRLTRFEPERDPSPLLKQILTDLKNYNALHLAVDQECPSTSQALLEKHPRLTEGCNEAGETPLSVFSYSSKISDQIFKAFVLAGAKFDHVCRNGWTPLHFFASEKDRFPYLKQLVESTVEAAKEIIFSTFDKELGSIISSYVGCFLNPVSWNLQTNDIRQTPLHTAIDRNNREAVEVLRKITNLSLTDQSGLPLKISLREFDQTLEKPGSTCSKCTIQ
jgi:ankyrin repeat protein